MEELKIQWHPAFCSAMELILDQDKEYLEFLQEYNLSKKPLEMDLLIIKKTASYKVKDDIGQIFKGHNIFEYKSPDDEMNIDTFYKVNAYAALYKASAKKVDEIKAEDISISFIRDTKPVKLINNLAKEGFRIHNPYKGIYYVEGKAYFSTQIIVVQELSGERHIWLQALTKHLDEQTARKLIKTAHEYSTQGEKQLINAIFAVSVKANRKLYDSVKEDMDMYEALRELMADEINESIEEKVNNTRQEDLKALVYILKEVFQDFDAAYQRIITTEAYAGISKEQVMRYWK